MPVLAGRTAIALALGLLVSAVNAPAAALRELSDVRVVRGDARVAVEVRTSASGPPRVLLLAQPWRVVLDFQDTAYRWQRTRLVVDSDPIKEIRGSQYRPSVARLVIELTRRVPYTVVPHGQGVRIELEHSLGAAPPSSVPRVRPPGSGGGGGRRPVLQGIVVGPEGPVAYLLAPGAEQAQGYRVGDRVDGGRIEAIGERHVVLETGDGRVELRLHVSEPGPTP